jgi:pyruvate,water dikinase
MKVIKISLLIIISALIINTHLFADSLPFIKKFEDVRLSDIAEVGGKNASLGEMIGTLSDKGVRVPHGFAITAHAYWYFLEYNNLLQQMQNSMAQLTDSSDLELLKKVGEQIRNMIEQAELPEDLAQHIADAYHELSERYGQTESDVAVRSSATAEDLPTASFAGQQETFLNVRGVDHILENYKKCIASLFTDRAISYRIEQGFDHFKVALSVGIQKMIRSDIASSGVSFSLDAETGFKDVIMIDAAYGLGEGIVQGSVTPDQCLVHKPTLEKGFSSIIKKQIGAKHTKMVYTNDPSSPITTMLVPEIDRNKFSLSDQDIIELARTVLLIEKHYSELKGSWSPMDIEWAKDGIDGHIYIVQARPETVHSAKIHSNTLTKYTLHASADILNSRMITSGASVGQQIVVGNARIILDVKDIDQIQKGEILVTYMTDPNWVPAMKKAAGIITDRGGRTCHAAIVSRELGIPAIVGTQNATDKIVTGQKITLDCSQGKNGYVYTGQIPFSVSTIELGQLPKPPVDIMVNIADPDSVFEVSYLPAAGVGLARLEFIINNAIKVHPMALVHPEKVTDAQVIKTINELTIGYTDKTQFFVDALAQGVGMIASAFYPRPVIVRLSDFKSNEYRNLIGGVYFEPIEENPMIGFRGASRYYHEKYREAFALECRAMKKVRDEMGLTNVVVMIPFVRTTDEAQKVLQEMEKNGLQRGQNGLKVIMMCEIPSNVILVDEFSQLLDGFSIGSNDLTQLTLGVDRDSELLAKTFDERNAAVQKMLKMAIEGANRNGKYIGICGQAPSDYPEIGQSLIDFGIHSLSLNIDSVIPFILRYKK